MEQRYGRRAGFSLIELVIVVVIIAIIGAIAIPKMSRGATGAADAALVQDLSLLRTAMDHYLAEHNGQPPSISMVYAMLTLYSDEAGSSGQTNVDAQHPYGPYLRGIPAVPVGPRKGQSGIGAVDGPTIGWIYEPGSGNFRANAGTAVDGAGKAYSTY